MNLSVSSLMVLPIDSNVSIKLLIRCGTRSMLFLIFEHKSFNGSSESESLSSTSNELYLFFKLITTLQHSSICDAVLLVLLFVLSNSTIFVIASLNCINSFDKSLYTTLILFSIVVIILSYSPPRTFHSFFSSVITVLFSLTILLFSFTNSLDFSLK